MAFEEISYNDEFNDMPWAYLRTRIVAGWINKQTPEQVPTPREDEALCDCCDVDKRYIHLALADTSDSDPYRNDYAPLLFDLPVTGTLVHTLQKWNGTAWYNVVTLDSTYGTTYNPGIFTDKPNFAGYRLQWRAVLTNHGAGFYRVRTVITVFGTPSTYLSDAYCLKPYSIYAADKTVKIEWNNNGIVTYADDDFVYTDYGNINWQQMLRVRGSFGYVKDEQEKVELDYFHGNSIKTDTIHDIINYKYTFKSGFYPFWVHSVLRNIAFKSNSLVFTTYGRLEKKDYVRKAVIKESNGYSPDYGNVYKKWFKVEVEFKDKYDDLGFRKNCAESGNNCEPVTIYDENGNVIDTIPSGGQYVDSPDSGSDVSVSNSNDTYTASPSCGGSLELPDTTVNVYINGVLRTSGTIVTLDPAAIVNVYP